MVSCWSIHIHLSPSFPMQQLTYSIIRKDICNQQIVIKNADHKGNHESCSLFPQSKKKIKFTFFEKKLKLILKLLLYRVVICLILLKRILTLRSYLKLLLHKIAIACVKNAQSHS